MRHNKLNERINNLLTIFNYIFQILCTKKMIFYKMSINNSLFKFTYFFKYFRGLPITIINIGNYDIPHRLKLWSRHRILSNYFENRSLRALRIYHHNPRVHKVFKWPTTSSSFPTLCFLIVRSNFIKLISEMGRRRVYICMVRCVRGQCERRICRKSFKSEYIYFT